MIKNERQYSSVKSQVAKLGHLLEKVCQDVDRASKPMGALEVRAIRTELDQLGAQLVEFENLKTGVAPVGSIQTVDELPLLLIRARIANGLSQKDLADQLQIKEQQIQRYEATNYAGASIGRLSEIAAILGVRLSANITLAKDVSVDSVVARLVAAGIHPELVRTRLGDGDLERKPDLLTLVSNIGRVYGWTADALCKSGRLVPTGPALATANFKTAEHVDTKKYATYAVYAYYLAQLSVQATPTLRFSELPNNPAAFREELGTMGGTSFESILKYVWDHGVVVLPLDDPGAFHGAMWKFRDRPVIVLKQRNRRSGRWLFDLLHEVWHVIEHESKPDAQILDVDDVLAHRVASPHEKRANRFAMNVLLDGRPDALAEECVTQAGGKIERLAKATPIVAKSAGVPISALAMHLAYLIDEDFQGEHNWWPTAVTLSATDEDHWMIARDTFIQHATFEVLTDVDRQLLVRALEETA